MRTTIAALLALGLLVATPAGLAKHPAEPEATFEESGEILLGQPTPGPLGGVSGLAAPCDTESSFNGIDGRWHDIDGFAEHPFELTMDETLDADVWFYAEDCSRIGTDVGARQAMGTPEKGTAPEDARYAIVEGFLGTGSYTLSLWSPEQS